MNAEQQLREAMGYWTLPIGLDNFGKASNPVGLDPILAAVGRLLDPIPEEVREQMFQGLPTSHVIEWYRAWLIGGES